MKIVRESKEPLFWAVGTLNDIIKEIKSTSMRPHYLSDDELFIDTVDILESLKEFEVDDIGDFSGLTEDSPDVQVLHKYNTYNWSSPVNHDLNMIYFEFRGEEYVAVAAHISGDVRTNYTDYAILNTNMSAIMVAGDEAEYGFKDLGHGIEVQLTWTSETYGVYDYEEGEPLGDGYFQIDKKDLFEQLAEDYPNLKDRLLGDDDDEVEVEDVREATGNVYKLFFDHSVPTDEYPDDVTVEADDDEVAFSELYDAVRGACDFPVSNVTKNGNDVTDEFDDFVDGMFSKYAEEGEVYEVED